VGEGYWTRRVGAPKKIDLVDPPEVRGEEKRGRTVRGCLRQGIGRDKLLYIIGEYLTRKSRN